MDERKRERLLKTIQTVTGISSVAVAVLALIVAFFVENRNYTRFKQQLEQSKKIAEANVKPLLLVQSEVYENVKSINLANRGVGVAVITKIEFSRGGGPVNNIVDLFEFKSNFAWDTFQEFSVTQTYLSPGKQISLVRLTEKGLTTQGFDATQIRRILNDWQIQKSGIKICVEYQDVLGNQQNDYVVTLEVTKGEGLVR